MRNFKINSESLSYEFKKSGFIPIFCQQLGKEFPRDFLYRFFCESVIAIASGLISTEYGKPTFFKKIKPLSLDKFCLILYRSPGQTTIALVILSGIRRTSLQSTQKSCSIETNASVAHSFKTLPFPSSG